MEKRERDEQVDMGVPVLSPKWSQLLEDSERDMIKKVHRTEVSTKKCGTEGKATINEEGDEGRWFPVDTISAMFILTCATFS